MAYAELKNVYPVKSFKNLKVSNQKMKSLRHLKIVWSLNKTYLKNII